MSRMGETQFNRQAEQEEEIIRGTIGLDKGSMVKAAQCGG